MIELSMRCRRVDDVDVIQVAGALDLPASLRIRTELYDRLDDDRRRLVVDLSALRLLDCAAVGTLVEVGTEAGTRGGFLCAPGATGLVLAVLEITGAAKKLRAYDDPAWYATTEPLPPVPAAGSDRGDTDDVAEPGQWTAVNELLRQLRDMAPDNPHRTALRQRVVRDCLPLADKLSRRFYGLGESPADLAQVAALGLLKSIDGFDPDFGTDFGGYATPTIVGELKRHFRDKGWGVHVPRRMQELRLDVNRARDELTQRLGRSPTTADVAEHLDIDEETVVEALIASSAYRPTSIYLPLGSEGDAHTLADLLGDTDDELDHVEYRQALKPILARLPQRERRILSLRFYGNLTQAEIATDLGISQMHVSRLLTRTLSSMRRALLTDDG